jgi:hypothetical protein
MDFTKTGCGIYPVSTGRDRILGSCEQCNQTSDLAHGGKFLTSCATVRFFKLLLEVDEQFCSEAKRKKKTKQMKRPSCFPSLNVEFYCTVDQPDGGNFALNCSVRCAGLTTLPPPCADYLQILGAWTLWCLDLDDLKYAGFLILT